MGWVGYNGLQFNVQMVSGLRHNVCKCLKAKGIHSETLEDMCYIPWQSNFRPYILHPSTVRRRSASRLCTSIWCSRFNRVCHFQLVLTLHSSKMTRMHTPPWAATRNTPWTYKMRRPYWFSLPTKNNTLPIAQRTIAQGPALRGHNSWARSAIMGPAGHTYWRYLGAWGMRMCICVCSCAPSKTKPPVTRKVLAAHDCATAVWGCVLRKVQANHKSEMDSHDGRCPTRIHLLHVPGWCSSCW